MNKIKNINTNFENFLYRSNQVIDYLYPFGLVLNLSIIFQKTLLDSWCLTRSSTYNLSNRYLIFLKNKSYTESVLLCLPIINVITRLYKDIFRKNEITELDQSFKDFTTAMTNKFVNHQITLKMIKPEYSKLIEELIRNYPDYKKLENRLLIIEKHLNLSHNLPKEGLIFKNKIQQLHSSIQSKF